MSRLSTATLTVGSTTVAPVSSVRNLGIFVDSDLVIRTYVCRTVSSCFAALRHLCSIRHLVSATVFQSLVAALVLCRLDYGNGTLVALPAYLVHRLKSVQSADCRTQRRDWHSVSVDLIISRMHSLYPPLAACARIGKDYFKDRRADLSRSPWRCTAVHTDRRHPVSTKTVVFFIRRSTRSCC